MTERRWTLTTHLRARVTQAGAFLALVVGLVAGVQTAALAEPPTVNIESLSEAEVTPGSTVTMQYTVRNPGAAEVEDARVSIRVSGIQCRNGCTPSQDIRDQAGFTATLVAPNVPEGQTQEVTITVTATLNETGESSSASDTLRVKGPDAPKTVRQVSGKIKSSDGERLSGVDVAMTDSAGGQFSARTNGDGGYSFTSSDSKPIAPGGLTVGAVKDGFQAKTVNVQGGAGKSVNVSITLKKLASESPSPSPSASASVSAEPTEEVTDEEEPTEEASDPAGAVNTDNLSAEAEGGTNWLLIIMGALLVAAGIGAFALVWLRRKNSSDDASAGESASPGFGGPGPATAGAFDATRVAAPVGAGRGGDATMIAPAGGMPAGISDAPTMVHRPVEDEFPDPYGAPIPPHGGFASANGQWDDQDNDGYGDGQQQYGQQAGYGDQGGYGNVPQQRYDEHTNLYQPEQAQPPQRYDEHTSLYQPEPGGGGYGGQQQYGQQGGYGTQDDWAGQPEAGNGGYGPQDGYGQPQQPGGGYGGYDQQQGGYDDQGGYGAQPPQQYAPGGGQPPQQYGGQQGGYEQQRGGAYSGYDQQQGGYGDPEGYYGPQNGQPAPPPAQPGQRPNRNDWDD